MNETFLQKKLDERRQQNAFRTLRLPSGKIDFCSNDYLGLGKRSLVIDHWSLQKEDALIVNQDSQPLNQQQTTSNQQPATGSTGRSTNSFVSSK
jgi:7-keto-8-aminopelargonate synthetase-like enzyme